MAHRIAFDRDVLGIIEAALTIDDEASGWLEAESIAAVRIYLYLGPPLVVPAVALDVAPRVGSWAALGFEEVAADDFLMGCAKGMSERYVDYYADASDCRVVAEAECANANVLVTMKDELITGLTGRIESIDLLKPSTLWERARVTRGAEPRMPQGALPALQTATWWRW